MIGDEQWIYNEVINQYRIGIAFPYVRRLTPMVTYEYVCVWDIYNMCKRFNAVWSCAYNWLIQASHGATTASPETSSNASYAPVGSSTWMVFVSTKSETMRFSTSIPCWQEWIHQMSSSNRPLSWLNSSIIHYDQSCNFTKTLRKPVLNLVETMILPALQGSPHHHVGFNGQHGSLRWFRRSRGHLFAGMIRLPAYASSWAQHQTPILYPSRSVHLRKG